MFRCKHCLRLVPETYTVDDGPDGDRYCLRCLLDIGIRLCDRDTFDRARRFVRKALLMEAN